MRSEADYGSERNYAVAFDSENVSEGFHFAYWELLKSFEGFL